MSLDRATFRDWLGRYQTVQPGDSVLVDGEPEPVTVLRLDATDNRVELLYTGKWGHTWASTNIIRALAPKE